MSADQMLKALLGSKHKVSMDLRSNLKSVKKDGSKKEDVSLLEAQINSSYTIQSTKKLYWLELLPQR